MPLRPRFRLGAALSAAALLAVAALALPSGCGARSPIPFPDPPAPPVPPRSSAFCARVSYPAGYSGLSIYLLLDQSGSMADDGKWDSVTAAIAAFADDPLVAGIGLGMQYFPIGDDCTDAPYAAPNVPIQLLPAGAPAIKASLAAHSPAGGTPTLPALRGAIEYARASLLAEPARNVIIVLATDGNPDSCESGVGNVTAAAAEGLSGAPQVVTAVIGLAKGSADSLAEIAAAGGAGAPIPVGTGPGAAQQFVAALRSIRDAALKCRFAIPSTPGATPAAADLAVSHAGAPGAPSKVLALVDGAASCDTTGGFYVDDPVHPTAVVLCPGSCEDAHASAGSSVVVTAGCGEGSPPPGAPTGDAGMSCSGSVDFSCLAHCGAPGPGVVAVCVGNEWVCPQGTVSTNFCGQCQIVPHGCCKPDGTLGEASCIDGAWSCPPGAQLFGEGACKPPTVCAATFPCALSQLCVVPDGSCGVGSVPGTCQPLPATCPSGGPPVCGCNAQVYPNACAAAAVGLDVSANGGCAAPAGTFACGPLFCRIGKEVCRTVDDFGKSIAPYSYACVATPPGCPTGCGCGLCPACPAPLKCSEMCTTDGSGGANLTCQEL